MQIVLLPASAHQAAFQTVVLELVAAQDEETLTRITTKIRHIAAYGGHPQEPYSSRLKSILLPTPSMNPSSSKKLLDIVQSESYKTKTAYFSRMLLLGEKIYGRRKDLGLSQIELAKNAGSTQRIICELESGDYQPATGIGEELYDKLAKALKIDRDYLFSEKIDRRTFEVLSYIDKKLNWNWDIMQFMKLPYFVDLNTVQKHGFQLSNFQYIRYEYGPFDKKIYLYRSLFENNKFDVQFSYIGDFLDDIEETLLSLPIKNGEKLKKLSYETEPMKKLKAKPGGKEGWGQKLVLISK